MLKTQICVTRPQCVKIFPLLARDSTLNIPNKILLYKLLLRSMITYAAPVWSSTSPTNYRHLQVYQSKCLHVIGDLPRRTPISNLHGHLQIIPIHQFIYHITDKFFVSCPMHPNPLIRDTGNYTLQDLHRQYTIYRHKRIKHILLYMTSTPMSQCFFLLIVMLTFSLL